MDYLDVIVRLGNQAYVLLVLGFDSQPDFHLAVGYDDDTWVLRASNQIDRLIEKLG